MSKLTDLFATAFHGLADAVHTLAQSSAVDSDTKATIAASVAKVKEAAGAMGEAGEAAVVEAADKAPAVAGSLAADGVKLAGAAVPAVGPILSAVFGPVVQAAVSLAVAQFEESFEAHNKNHLEAARAVIQSLADAAPTAETAATVQAFSDKLVPPANADMPA